ncbi:hypothetical protein GHT06_017027 [Daphnia sinensis]|uniref:Uncharacterized protein n=1 Tax=Daphnia sinensis TaxID=1820382 RepID=A0AAD5L8E8_9CRUS|nr:hypothetical protein GHT06_017027 [Daphnia sinensis]
MPLDRTKRAQPFEVIGIDYFGSMYVLEEVILIEKDSDGKDIEKSRVGEKKPTALVTEVIPGTDGKVRAVISRLRSGKETTRSIETVYPLEVQADIDTPVDDAVIGTVEKTTSSKKKHPLRKRKVQSRDEAGDSSGEDVADCKNAPEDRTTKSGRPVRRSVIFDL